MNIAKMNVAELNIAKMNIAKMNIAEALPSSLLVCSPKWFQTYCQGSDVVCGNWEPTQITAARKFEFQ